MEPLVCVLVGKGFLHRLGALKEQNWISSGFWRLEPNIKVLVGWFLVMTLLGLQRAALSSHGLLFALVSLSLFLKCQFYQMKSLISKYGVGGHGASLGGEGFKL